MFVDYHNHTTYCNHAVGTMEVCLAAAEKQNIAEFGFSEHAPWMLGMEEHPLCPTHAGWQEYCREIEHLRGELRSRQSPMHLRFGIELDYYPGVEKIAGEFLNKYPFDYVIGSVHFVTNGQRPDGRMTLARARNVRHLYELYFREVRTMLATGLLDIVGHLDLPKRDGELPPGGYYDLIEDLVKALKDSDVAVEINTSGRDKPIQEFFPSPEIVRLLVRSGIPMTMGSDSHSPADVGRYIPEAYELLRTFGAREIMTFQGRRRIGQRI